MAHDGKKESSPASKPSVHSSTGTGPAFQHFQAAMVQLQQGKFDKALAAFEKLLAAAPTELLERCKMYISICQQQLDKRTLTFSTPEEHYDYAVSLMNVGDYVTAREHIEKLLKQSPKTDFVIYGLAALDCLTGHVEDSLKHLDEALRLNAGLRFQARNDSDFHNLAEDPRFTELLYPDPAADMASPESSFRDDESY